MPEALTRKTRRDSQPGGRLQIGIPADFISEYPAGLRRNAQMTLSVPFILTTDLRLSCSSQRLSLLALRDNNL